MFRALRSREFTMFKQKRVIALVALFATSMSSLPAAALSDAPYCQILDRTDEPVWHMRAGYVHDGKVERFGRMSMLELSAGSGIFYARTVAGEFDLRADVDATTFLKRGDISLPDQVAAIRLDLDYVARLDDGYALRLGFAPGVYSQITHLRSDHLHYPFRIHGIRAFEPDVSIMAGLDFFPRYDRLIEPRAGVRWNISDFLLLDAFYPNSEIVFRPTPDWAIRTGVEFNRKSEFALKSDDDRDRLEMTDTRIYLGVDRLLYHDIALLFRIGRVVDRSVDFRRFTPSRDIEDALFIQIGIGGLI